MTLTHKNFDRTDGTIGTLYAFPQILSGPCLHYKTFPLSDLRNGRAEIAFILFLRLLDLIQKLRKCKHDLFYQSYVLLAIILFLN